MPRRLRRGICWPGRLLVTRRPCCAVGSSSPADPASRVGSSSPADPADPVGSSSPADIDQWEHGGMTFAGFTEQAFDFYEGLRADNSKAYWTAHKDVYESAVRGPMRELLE